jgi:hypothetical protein
VGCLSLAALLLVVERRASPPVPPSAASASVARTLLSAKSQHQNKSPLGLVYVSVVRTEPKPWASPPLRFRMVALDYKARRARSKLPDRSYIPGAQTCYSMHASRSAWSFGVEVIPRVWVETTAVGVAKMKV